MTGADLPRRAYKVSEVAAMLGCSKDSIYALINSGQMKALRINSLKVVPVEEVDAYMQRMAG